MMPLISDAPGMVRERVAEERQSRQLISEGRQEVEQNEE
jgi:hypothetical protein